ncbi:hypothetical protein C6W19_09770 [Bacillus sp. RJGP41]|nr:hypothetical protein C6W19_09770 [Bacillus sp. RJGP41]
MFYKISKVLYLLFIFYMIWFQPVFFTINNAPLVLGMGMIIFLFFHMLNTKEGSFIIITKPVMWWLLFSFFILSTGYIIAHNKTLLISSVFTYIQLVVMILYIINVSKMEGSNRFFVWSYAFLSIVYAFTMLFWGYENNGILTVSIASNRNTDGLVLLYGIFCFLILLNFKLPFKLIFSIVSIGLLFYIIVLTGSRKSFIAAVLVILLWFLFVFKRNWIFLHLKIKLLLFYLIVPIIYFLVFKFIPLFLNSALFSRFNEGFGYEGDITRLAMYNTAFEYFYSNPLFGIGFNQFREIYGTYSHSTYAEILSTTGFIGTILYFIPYIIIIKSLIDIYRKNTKTPIASQSLIYIILMVVMLFLGTGVIHFYGIRDGIMLALMISFYYVEKFKKKPDK